MKSEGDEDSKVTLASDWMREIKVNLELKMAS